jgi:hypothetical protein
VILFPLQIWSSKLLDLGNAGAAGGGSGSPYSVQSFVSDNQAFPTTTTGDLYDTLQNTPSYSTPLAASLGEFKFQSFSTLILMRN